MTNLYAEWKKLRDNVQGASARLYSEKNENTERKYEEALERLAQFEKENGIPLMADEADVKKMFCPQTNEEWFCGLPTEEKAKVLGQIAKNAYQCCQDGKTNKCVNRNHCTGYCDYGWELWLKEKYDG